MSTKKKLLNSNSNSPSPNLSSKSINNNNNKSYNKDFLLSESNETKDIKLNIKDLKENSYNDVKSFIDYEMDAKDEITIANHSKTKDKTIQEIVRLRAENSKLFSLNSNQSKKLDKFENEFHAVKQIKAN